MGLDLNSQEAMRLYREAERLRDSNKGPMIGIEVAPMRVRLESDVDRSKADPNCKRCLGTGSLGNKVIPGNRGCEPTKVPIICRCVVAGVTPPRFAWFR